MTVDQVRKLYDARPFQPFRINLADGRSLRVDHPEFMSFSTGRSIVVFSQDDNAFEIVDLVLATGLQVGANGKGKHSGKK
jgi:hypothetical protein